MATTGARGPLPPRDVALLAAVAALWGFNFVPIRWALDDFPPFALAAVRFLLAALPMVFFVGRPPIPWRFLVLYGLAIGVGQFGLLFLAIRLGLAAGLSSLLIQVQVFFTVALSALLFRDPLSLRQVAGAGLAALGIALLWADQVSHGAGVTATGLALVVGAALCWAAGNVTAKAAGRRAPIDMFGLVVWSSLVPPLPLAVLSYMLEGGRAALEAVLDAQALAWASLLFMSYGATLFGFAAWNRMLHRHPAGLVAPFALLVPVAGLASAWVLLDEPLNMVRLVAAATVMVGLAVALIGHSGRGPRTGPSSPA